MELNRQKNEFHISQVINHYNNIKSKNKINNQSNLNNSNKSKECFNSSGLNMNINNPYDVFSPDKNITPFKASNANLDKMFFSNLNSKNEKI